MNVTELYDWADRLEAQADPTGQTARHEEKDDDTELEFHKAITAARQAQDQYTSSERAQVSALARAIEHLAKAMEPKGTK